MTFGFTGVVWAARTAEINSTLLNAGTHAVSMQVAAPAWGGLALAWQEATITVAAVMAELGVGMEGVNGLAALARLGGFAAWTEQQAVMSAALGIEAEINAIAYTVASIAMPSLPEIIATDTAKTAAYAHGGVIDGTAEAAEAVWVAMQARAAATMEVYEGVASAILTTPTDFLMPPPLVTGVGAAASFLGHTGNAIQDGIMAAPLAAQTAVGQVASFSGTAASAASSTMSSIAEVGTQAASTMAGDTTSAGLGSLPMGIGAAGAIGGAGAIGSIGSVSYSGNLGGGGSVQLPTGWAGAGMGGPMNGGSNLAGESTRPAAARPVTPSTALSQAARKEDEDDEHDVPDYLKNFEHFADGRTVAPAVIGAVTEAEPHR